MPFNYISEKGMTLTPSQGTRLARIEATNYSLAEFSSIENLRAKKKYKVIVSDRKSFVDTITKEIQAIDAYGKELARKSQNKTATEQEMEILHSEAPWRVIQNLKNVMSRMEDGRVRDEHGSARGCFPLLGLYRGWDFSYNSPAIYLFIENINDYALSKGVSDECVAGFVYVHEVMHAFYDSKNNSGYFSVEEMEEAFAECGMLNFLNNTIDPSDPSTSDMALCALDSVEEKQMYGPYEYGFGHALELFSDNEGITVNLIERYREVSNWIGGNIGYGSELWNYREGVVKLKKQSKWDPSYDKQARDCYELVRRILQQNHSKPGISINVFPGLEGHMRNAGVTPRKGAATVGGRSVSGIGSLGSIWDSEITLGCVSSSHSVQVPLFLAENPSELAHGVVCAIARVYGTGFHQYITDLSSKMGFGLRDPQNTIVNSSVLSYMPEPIRSCGQSYYIQSGWVLDPSRGRSGSPNVYELLERWLDTYGSYPPFSILRIGGKDYYVLFGEKTLASFFDSPRTLPRNGRARDLTKYELTDLRGNVLEGLGKAELVFEGVRSFVEANPRLTVAQVQAEFPQSLGGWGVRNSLEVVKPLVSIAPGQESRYSKGVLSASDGDFKVSNQWGASNIRNVIDKLNSLGMTVL